MLIYEGKRFPINPLRGVPMCARPIQFEAIRRAALMQVEKDPKLDQKTAEQRIIAQLKKAGRTVEYPFDPARTVQLPRFEDAKAA